ALEAARIRIASELLAVDRGYGGNEFRIAIGDHRSRLLKRREYVHRLHLALRSVLGALEAAGPLIVDDQRGAGLMDDVPVIARDEGMREDAKDENADQRPPPSVALCHACLNA